MGIETALIGLGMGAGTAGSVATGLSVLKTGFSIFSGISSIMGGMAGSNEANYQGELAAQQAESRAIEQERIAAREARLTQEESDEARKRQKVAYLASGVTLEGSPLLVMEETRSRGAENVNEILQSGSAAANSARAEGRIEASKYKASAREEFSSGLKQGISTLGGMIA